MAECALLVMWDASRELALMEDRPDLCPGSQHYWVYPGGKVEDGETSLTAVAREAFEELGVVLMDAQLLTITELFIRPKPGTKQYAKSPDGWRVTPFLVSNWIGVIPTHSLDDNHAPLEWKDPRDFAFIEPADPLTATVVVANRLVYLLETFEVQSVSRPQELSPALPVLACPFDGGTRLVVIKSPRWDGATDDEFESFTFHVTCTSCLARGPWTKSHTSACTAWNRRPKTSAPTPTHAIGCPATVGLACRCGLGYMRG